MSNETFDLLLEFRDGEVEKFTYVGVEVVKDGVLTLWSGIQNDYTKERKHFGSWPLDVVKKWVRISEY